MVDMTWTERQVFEIKLGLRKPDDFSLEPKLIAEHHESIAPKRAYAYDKRPMAQRLDDSDAVWKRCDICHDFICVNNWEDRKVRTPRFLKFIVCGNCDPRLVDDRYMKEGYRIVHKGRLRMIRMAQVTRAMSIRGCLKPDDPRPCKCAGCAALRMFP